MVIKPVEFAMIQQQNNVAKSQYNAENRPMTEQQTITQQVQKDINVHSQQVNKKDNADNETGKYDARRKWRFKESTGRHDRRCQPGR